MHQTTLGLLTAWPIYFPQKITVFSVECLLEAFMQLTEPWPRRPVLQDNAYIVCYWKISLLIIGLKVCDQWISSLAFAFRTLLMPVACLYITRNQFVTHHFQVIISLHSPWSEISSLVFTYLAISLPLIIFRWSVHHTARDQGSMVFAHRAISLPLIIFRWSVHHTARDQGSQFHGLCTPGNQFATNHFHFLLVSVREW